MKRNYFHIYNSQKVGFRALALGMFISILFGFIFGLILGTTEMPWGFGDFPTEEMKGRWVRLLLSHPFRHQPYGLLYDLYKTKRERNVEQTDFPTNNF